MSDHVSISVFDAASGRITRVCTLQEDFVQWSVLPTENFVYGEIDNSLYYIDTNTLEPVLYPPKLSHYHQFNFVTKQWEDTRTLEQVQMMTWNNMKVLRSQKESAGFTWDGSVFDSDRVSQSRIMGAVQLAGMNPAFEIPWTLQNNSVRVLNAADMISVGATLGSHVATIFARAQEIRTEIYAASTIAEVEAITWET